MHRIPTRWLCALVLCLPGIAMADDPASGSFRLGETTIAPRHAIAVRADSDGESRILVYLSVSPLDAAKVAAAFDPDDAVNGQVRDEPSGSYLKLCIDAEGFECGLDFATLRKLAGEAGAYRFPEDDPTSAKETLKSLRDGHPLAVGISRGRVDGDQAVLWVKGVDRDDIARAGRVLMQRSEGQWRFEEADLDAVD